MNTRLHASQVLRHPAWIASLALLLANDHLFKGSGLLPTVLTGKLSDLAGFFMFPFFITVLLRRRTRLGALICHVLAAILLLAIELSPTLCAFIARTTGFRMWADPTDLLALFSIAASWRFLLPVAERQAASTASTPAASSLPLIPVAERQASSTASTPAASCLPLLPIAKSPPPNTAPTPATMPWFSRTMLMVGSLASIATSMGPGPRMASMYLWNQRDQQVQARISVPRTGIRFDCATPMANRSELFSPEDFTVARHVLIDAHKSLILDDLARNIQCPVLLVSVEGYPDQLVIWSAGSLPSIEFENSPEEGSGVRIPTATRVLESPANVLFPAPSAGEALLPAGCEPPADGFEPDWSANLPRGSFLKVQDVQKGNDGCDVMVLMAASAVTRFTVCAEPIGVPFIAGDTISVRATGDGSNGIVIEGANKTLFLVRRGPVSSVESRSCPKARELCGTTEAIRARVKTPFGFTSPLGSGEQTTLVMGASTARVAVTRAENVLLFDSNCDKELSLAAIASYVTLIQ